MIKVRPLRIIFTALLFMGVLTSCEENPGKGKSTTTDSRKFATVDDRQAFLERYVSFRRSYEALDFDIRYKDSGGSLVPSPTEWDIRIAAKVPADEVVEWTKGLEPAAVGDEVDTGWVERIPNAPASLEGFEWFEDGARVVVGVDSEERVVLYRNLSL